LRLPRWLGSAATVFGGLLLVVWSIGPIAWMMIASLQPEGAVTSVPLHLTVDLRWTNYTNLFFNPGQFTTLPWLSSTWVSIQVAVLATVLTIIVSALIAYPLARLEVPGKGLFMGSLIATQMVPAIVLAIPVLLIFRTLGLVDSIAGLVIVNVAFSIPVIAWLLRNAFEEVPRSIESAARIDGCSRLGTLFRVTMPAARPGIAAASILMLIGTWNEFLFAVVLGNHDAVTVTRLIGLVNTTTGPMGRPPYTLVAAAGVVAIAPCVALVVLFYRQIVRGLTESYVKG
jgi:multiple sugar transport system permease protein